MAVVSMTDPLSSFTITLEVYPETESGVIMHYRGNNIPGIIVQLLKGILYVTVKQVIMAGGYIPANTWTSLAISYDSPSGTFYLYVNGYQIDSSPGHQLLIGLGILQLGNDVYEAGMGHFKGMMMCLSLYDVSVQSFDRYNLMHKGALTACSQDIFTTMSRMLNYPEISTNIITLLVWQPSSKNIMDSIRTRDLASTSDTIWLTTTGRPRQPPSSSSNTMIYMLIGVLTAAVVVLGLVISHLIRVCRRKKKTKKDKAGTSTELRHRSDNTENERMENIYVMS
ncbi:hypothetical protein SNE40_015848 [Patella caerulea]